VEYYAGTESNGMTVIDSATWLTRPGSVGQAVLGTLRICADDGTELPAGEIGGVYFERDAVPVNVYPQEIENVLALHPAVYDVAVIGVPDPEMGESVAAFIQPAAGTVRGPELAQEIVTFVKSKIASFKAPRVVRFVDNLPRTETGKLMKAELKAKYARH